MLQLKVVPYSFGKLIPENLLRSANKDKSIEMFHIIADKYVPDGNYEKMARIWNGGPSAHIRYVTKNDQVIENKYYIRTNDYWLKVKNELNKEK